jgi:hypothetical protein
MRGARWSPTHITEELVDIGLRTVVGIGISLGQLCTYPLPDVHVWKIVPILVEPAGVALTMGTSAGWEWEY